jgi:hypothetical protein
LGDETQTKCADALRESEGFFVYWNQKE